MYSRIATLQRYLQRDLTQGLAVAAPKRLQGAEGGAQVDAGGSLGPVVRGQVLGGHTGFESFQVYPFARCGPSSRRRYKPLGVLRPLSVALASAEDFEAAGLVALGAVDYQLHSPARFRRFTIPIIFGVNQGIEQLELFYC